MIMCNCFCTVGSVCKCAPQINTFYYRADFCVLIISHNLKKKKILTDVIHNFTILVLVYKKNQRFFKYMKPAI